MTVVVGRRALLASGGGVALIALLGGCAMLRQRASEPARSTVEEVDQECARIQPILSGLPGVVSAKVWGKGYAAGSLDDEGVAVDYVITPAASQQRLTEAAVKEVWLSTIEPGPRVTIFFAAEGGGALGSVEVPLGRVDEHDKIPPGLTQSELAHQYGPRPGATPSD